MSVIDHGLYRDFVGRMDKAGAEAWTEKAATVYGKDGGGVGGAVRDHDEAVRGISEYDAELSGFAQRHGCVASFHGQGVH